MLRFRPEPSTYHRSIEPTAAGHAHEWEIHGQGDRCRTCKSRRGRDDVGATREFRPVAFDRLPATSGPCVYLWTADRPGSRPRVIYVGQTTDLRSRIYSHFAGTSSIASKVAAMEADMGATIGLSFMRLACACDLDDRESALIAAFRPAANRNRGRKRRLAPCRACQRRAESA